MNSVFKPNYSLFIINYSLERVSYPKIIYNIFFPATLIMKLKLVHYPRILLPWFAYGNTYIEPDHEQPDIKPDTCSDIHR